jgi:chromosome partitioning protein
MALIKTIADPLAVTDSASIVGTVEELGETPQSEIERPKPSKIALLSRKGGVGKTTTAVNLGAALAALGKRVLIMDLDGQASASLSLGVDRSALTPSSADVLLSTLPITEAIRPTAVPGLDLITGSADLLTADMELSGFKHKEVRLKTKFEPIDQVYDFVFFDCPCSLSLLPINALVASEAYLVLIAPQYLIVQGLDNFLAAVERVKGRVGARADLLGLLITLVDRRLRISRFYVDELRRLYGGEVFSSEIGVNVRLAEAPSHGQTIFDYENDSRGARAYRVLATELLMRCNGSPAFPWAYAPDAEVAGAPV